MKMTPEEELLQLRALVSIQTADLACLYNLVRSTRMATGQSAENFDALYIHERKQRLHVLLELLEKTQPELAAKMLKLIEDSSTNLPLGYD